jgi:hypothetical protein
MRFLRRLLEATLSPTTLHEDDLSSSARQHATHMNQLQSDKKLYACTYSVRYGASRVHLTFDWKRKTVRHLPSVLANR